MTKPPHYEEILNVLTPESVAIIGSSDNITKVNGKVLHFLVKHGYRGQIYPVNPNKESIFGFACYPDLGSIPGNVDHVIYVISSRDIKGTLEQCKAKGVKAVTILSSGFAETGTSEGKDLQKWLKDFSEESGIRIIGPNCFGFINFVDRVAASPAAALDWAEIPAGKVGLVTQSGGIGQASVFYGALEEHIYFSHIIGCGNEVDLEVSDFIKFLAEDPNTNVIALVIEGIKDGRKFVEAVDLATKMGKPIIALKVGRSNLGQAMAASHTGSMTGSDKVYDALFRQKGITRVDDYDELYQLAGMFSKLMSTGKLPTGKGITSLSVSGGHVGLLGDLGDFQGLSFPPFSEQTTARLRTVLPEFGSFRNPLDLTGQAVSDPKSYRKCLEIVLEDPSINIAVPIITVAKNYDQICEDFLEVDSLSSKPIIVLWPGGTFEGQGPDLIKKSHIPYFKTPNRAVKGLLALIKFVEYLDKYNSRREDNLGSLNINNQAVRRELELAISQGKSALTERESKKILAACGFPVPREGLASTVDEAVTLAESIGYPVVLKGESPELLHKSDSGIIRLGLRNSVEVKDAFYDIERKMDSLSAAIHVNGILVQQMVALGTEIILGASHDNTFGPTVMFGLGGIFVEVMKDVSLRPLPIHFDDANQMIREIKGFKMLTGVRGRPAANLNELARLIQLLSQLVQNNEDLIKEVDINPIIIGEEGKLTVVDALIVLTRR